MRSEELELVQCGPPISSPVEDLQGIELLGSRPLEDPTPPDGVNGPVTEDERVTDDCDSVSAYGLIRTAVHLIEAEAVFLGDCLMSGIDLDVKASRLSLEIGRKAIFGLKGIARCS